MCGISGVAGDAQDDGLEPLVRRMVLGQHHRGPDANAVIRNKGVVLGHNRLSIIDVEGGQQPMSTTDGRYTIVFNGEVYNYKELKSHLPGTEMATASDTEVLLLLYAKYGAECLALLNGMYAFAIHDNQANSLFIARDRLGVKPLYYAIVGDRFLFSSEIGVLAEAIEDRTVDHTSIADYLSLMYIPAPDSIYKEIRKLPPAHSLFWDGRNEKITCYWSPWETQTDEQISASDALEKLDSLLSDATRLRLISDVPLGAFLSGGVDSSTVVATMAGISSEPVKTFSIGFEEAGLSETQYARMVAEKYGTDHHERILSVKDIPAAAERMVEQFGEPFGDSSAIPTYLVSTVARELVTVALSGDGGDEFFGGYGSYQYMNRLSGLDWIPTGIAQPAAAMLSKLNGRRHDNSRLAKLARAARRSALSPAERWSEARGYLFQGAGRDLLSDDMPATRSSAWFQRLFETSGGNSVAETAMRVDAQSYLPEELLVKVDRSSMASSLEVRSPFLDYRIAEFAMTLPLGLKVRNGEGKWLIKQLMADKLPHDVMYRQKQGFGIPISRWFAGELNGYLRETLGGSKLLAEVTRPSIVSKVIQEHVIGQYDHADLLWMLLVLALWEQKFL